MANFIDLKGFACHWRFVIQSQQLCNKSFLLPDIEVSSFSFSCPLLQSFNRQVSKHNNLASKVEIVPLGAVDIHVKLNEVSSPGYYFFLVWRPKFFIATILQLKAAKRQLFENVSLECYTCGIKKKF